MPLAIVIYVDGSFIKNKIAVKPIYITVHNLNSAVSGKSLACRLLGMLPALKKKPTLGDLDSLLPGAPSAVSGCIMHAWIPSIGSVLRTLTCFARMGR